jgi:AcrR family transcriptional regulator
MARTADPALRAKLLRVARAVFAEKGFADTGMRDIAARADIAVGTIYLYFKTKEALANALCVESSARLNASVLQPLSQPDLRLGLAAAVEAAFDAYGDEKDILRLIYLNRALADTVPADVIEASDVLSQAFRELLERGVAAGQIRPYDDFALLTNILFNTFDQAALMHYVHGLGERAAYKRALTMFVHGALLVDQPAQAKPKPGRATPRNRKHKAIQPHGADL